MTNNQKPVKKVKSQSSSIFSSVSQPTIRESITLHSASAQKIMEREFNRLSSSFFYLDVSLLYVGDTSAIEKYRVATDKAYMNLKQEIQNAINNTKKLAEKNGISSTISYQDVKQYDVEITNPRSMEFLQLIQLFDELIKTVDSVWIRNEMLVGGSKKRLEHHQEWQRRIIRFMQEITRFQVEQLRIRQRKDQEEKQEPTAQQTEQKKTKEPADSKKTTDSQENQQNQSPVPESNEKVSTTNDSPLKSQEASTEDQENSSAIPGPILDSSKPVTA